MNESHGGLSVLPLLGQRSQWLLAYGFIGEGIEMLSMNDSTVNQIFGDRFEYTLRALERDENARGFLEFIHRETNMQIVSTNGSDWRELQEQDLVRLAQEVARTIRKYLVFN